MVSRLQNNRFRTFSEGTKRRKFSNCPGSVSHASEKFVLGNKSYLVTNISCFHRNGRCLQTFFVDRPDGQTLGL